jgi:hypothetical protein
MSGTMSSFASSNAELTPVALATAGSSQSSDYAAINFPQQAAAPHSNCKSFFFFVGPQECLKNCLFHDADKQLVRSIDDDSTPYGAMPLTADYVHLQSQLGSTNQ